MSNVATVQALLIEVDDRDLTVEAGNALKEVRIRQHLSESTVCTLIFTEPEGGRNFIRNNRLMVGVRLQLSTSDRQAPIFSGTITGFEYRYGPAGQVVVTVSAADDLYALTKHQPVTAHIQVTVPELAETMLSGSGISVEADSNGPVWDHIVQHRVSDLAFLKDYAERSGLYFWLSDRTIRFCTLQPGTSTTTLEYGLSLLEVTLKNNARWHVDSVTAQGWNPWQAQAQSGQATQTADARSDFADARLLSNQAAQSDAQMVALASAELDQAATLEKSISGTAEGDFGLVPGTDVRIANIDDTLAGPYRLTAVEHRINAEQGFITSFETTPPTPVSRSHDTMATMARVTQVEDPENLGRVKVLLPGYNDVESDWLEVVLPAAGANKGLLMLPDIDDTVLVLMLNGRPDQSLVIGGLYGQQGPPDQNIKNNAVHRYSLLTPGGQAIRMNDLDDTITIENSNGSRVELNGNAINLETADGHRLEMNEQCLRLFAQTDCHIEAPGHKLTLKADKIDFERG